MDMTSFPVRMLYHLLVDSTPVSNPSSSLLLSLQVTLVVAALCILVLPPFRQSRDPLQGQETTE